MDWTFFCYQCGEMASMKTCPHTEKAVLDEEGGYVSGDRLLLSGTMLRKMRSEGKAVPKEFSKPEVVVLLREFYAELEDKVEVKLHGAATGDAAK
jgi:sulfate adenylyltransferase